MKKNHKLSNRELTLIAGNFTLSAILSLSGCGSGNGGGSPSMPSSSPATVATTSPVNAQVATSTNPQLACPGGEYNPFGLGCVPAANFQSACSMSAFGNVIVSNTGITNAADGTSVCQSYLYTVVSPVTAEATPLETFRGMSPYPQGGSPANFQNGNSHSAGGLLIPRITPSSAQSGTHGILLPISVLAADSLKIMPTGNLGWSTGSFNSLSNNLSNPGGFNTVLGPQQSPCAQTPISGGSTQNEGQPEGLMISDGTSAYFVGNQQYVQIFRYSRGLFAGFNVPSGTSGCFELSSLAVRIARCLDISGNAHVCSNPQ